MFSGFFGYLFGGLVIGVLARLIKPGADPMGWIMTLLLGVVGVALVLAVIPTTRGWGLIPAALGATLCGMVFATAMGAWTSTREGEASFAGGASDVGSSSAGIRPGSKGCGDHWGTDSRRSQQ